MNFRNMGDVFVQMADSKRLLEKIAHPQLRKAGLRWYSRHHSKAHPLTLFRLASDWNYLARRHSSNVNPRIPFSLFDRLASLPPTRLPTKETVRYLLRSLMRFPQFHSWENLAAKLNQNTHTLTAKDWRSEHQSYRQNEKNRQASRVTFDEMVEQLTRFNSFLFMTQVLLPLKQVKLEGFTASTDGKFVSLPEEIDLTPHRVLNEWGYLRLLAHEVEHIEAGTFAFSFDSPNGQLVWQRLATRRKIFHRKREEWDGQLVLERLLRSGDEFDSHFKPYLPHLVAFTLHFDSPKATHGLFNLVEDIRVEASLAAKYPALGEVAEILADYEVDLLPHPQFHTAAENFTRWLHSYVLGRQVPVYITREFQAAVDRVGPILDRFRATESDDVGASVVTTLDLIEALEQTLPPTVRHDIAEDLASSVRVALEDVAFRLAKKVAELEYDDFEKEYIKVSYPDRPEPIPDGPGQYSVYPEYNIWERRLLPNVVYLQERCWTPWRAPQILPRSPFSDYLELPLDLRHGPDERCHHVDGDDLDLDRVYSTMVGLRIGRPIDDRIFRAWHSHATTLWTVSLAVDLSISMEVPRGLNVADTPLMRAVSVASKLTEWLERSNISTEVVGVHDHGRRSVCIYTVKGFGDRFCHDRIASIHAVGVGGFRHGAIIRHLATSSKRERPGTRHLIILMSDVASHYIAPSFDEVGNQIVKSRCAACRNRAHCPIEAIDARLTMRHTTAPLNLYFPTFYEMHDLADARIANPHVEILFALFDTGYPSRILDKAVGSGRSLQLTSDQAGDVIHKVRQILRETSKSEGHSRDRQKHINSKILFLRAD